MRLFVVIVAVMSVGCASAIRISDKEECATRDLKLEGVDSGQVDSFHAASNGAYVRGNSYGEVRRCGVPSSEAEKREISDLKAAAEPKVEYNSGIKGKRLLTAVGYVFWVVPGILLKYMYDGQYDEAVAQSNKIQTELAAKRNGSVRGVATDK